jgi:hypothetical protein
MEVKTHILLPARLSPERHFSLPEDRNTAHSVKTMR